SICLHRWRRRLRRPTKRLGTSAGRGLYCASLSPAIRRVSPGLRFDWRSAIGGDRLSSWYDAREFHYRPHLERGRGVQGAARRVAKRSMSADQLLAFREEFPILEKTNYLVSNSLGPMPRTVPEKLAEYARDW